MDSFSSGTLGGAGSFRCQTCGYVLTLAGSDRLSDCPGCGGREWVRASMFSTERIHGGAPASAERTLAEPVSAESRRKLAELRKGIEQPGEYLCYEENGEFRTVALTREWTRVGRSLAADVRFDDPTVSRRHALIVRQPDGVRVLDDRSLNGVFVNGARVEWSPLRHGDEIRVGRHRLYYATLEPVAATPAPAPAAG